MRMVVQGTKSFNDYTIFLRAMGTALSSMEDGDDELIVYSAGPSHINEMAMEFTNISERSLKARGIKIKMLKMPIKWLRSNLNEIDYLAFFSKPKEPITELIKAAEAKDLDVGIYRY
jgi:hypothetical protein